MTTSKKICRGLSNTLWSVVLSSALVIPAQSNESIPDGGANPPAVKQCGFDLVLLLDASSSIRDYGGAADVNGAVDEIVDASSALLSAFAGTNSRVAVVSYNNLARLQLGFTDVTSASIAAGGAHQVALGTPWTSIPVGALGGYTSHVAVPDLSTGINPATGFSIDTGFTNWQAGFEMTHDVLTNGARAGVPTLVMHLTDGRPTAYSVDQPDGSQSYGVFGKQPPSQGVTAANLVKTFDSGLGTGTHVYSIGVKGGELDPINLLQTYLSAASGPNVFDETAGDVVSDFDAINDDVILLSDFEKLRAIFSRFATSLCAPSVTLTKFTNSIENLDSFVATPGWQFGAEVVSSPDSAYSWVLPDDSLSGSMATSTSAPAGSSDVGRVQFQWDISDLPSWTGDTTFTEVAMDGHELTSVSCTRTQLGEDETATSSAFTPTIVGQEFDISVGVNDIISCQVVNEVDQSPALSLSKTASPSTYDEVGDVITYEFKVTSTGIAPVHPPIVINDDRVSNDPIPCFLPIGSTVLLTNQTATCTVEYSITAADLALDQIVNTATATGTDGNGGLVNSDPASATIFIDELILMEMTKEANPVAYHSVGQIVTYTYMVTNTGNRPLPDSEQVVISDDRIDDDSITCESSLGLLPGDSIACTSSYEITEDDLFATSVVNIATASVTGVSTPPVDAEIKLTAIQLEKTVEPSTYMSVGETLNYNFKVTNTGAANIYGPVLIYDDRLGLSGYACRESADVVGTPFTPGQSVQCGYDYVTNNLDVAAGVSGINNVAQATADGAESEDGVFVVYTGDPAQPGPCDVDGNDDDNDDGSDGDKDKTSAKKKTEAQSKSDSKSDSKSSSKSDSKKSVDETDPEDATNTTECVDADGNRRPVSGAVVR